MADQDFNLFQDDTGSSSAVGIPAHDELPIAERIERETKAKYGDGDIGITPNPGADYAKRLVADDIATAKQGRVVLNLGELGDVLRSPRRGQMVDALKHQAKTGNALERREAMLKLAFISGMENGKVPSYFHGEQVTVDAEGNVFRGNDFEPVKAFSAKAVPFPAYENDDPVAKWQQEKAAEHEAQLREQWEAEQALTPAERTAKENERWSKIEDERHRRG